MPEGQKHVFLKARSKKFLKADALRRRSEKLARIAGRTFQFSIHSFFLLLIRKSQTNLYVGAGAILTPHHAITDGPWLDPRLGQFLQNHLQARIYLLVYHLLLDNLYLSLAQLRLLRPGNTGGHLRHGYTWSSGKKGGWDTVSQHAHRAVSVALLS